MTTATATLPRDHTPTEPCKSARDEALNSIFTTALEGGIGYWSTCSRYHWSTGDGRTEARDFIAVVHELDDENEPKVAHVIDRAVIVKGLDRAYNRRAMGNDDYHAQALKALYFGRYDDADYDADTADLIVQYGLFDAAVYG